MTEPQSLNEPQSITTDHVRALLAAESGGAILGLIEGQVKVIDADQRDADQYAGALEVVSRDELAQRLGDDPSDDDLNTQAEALSIAVQQLGG